MLLLGGISMVLSRTWRPAFIRTHIALGVIAATGALCANAAQFQTGDVDISFNTQITLGGSWRAGNPDKDLLAGTNIKGDTDPTDNASTSVTDDGDLNYQKGDLFSLIANVRHDLSIEYENVGAFTRVKYWYDYALAEKNVPHGNSLNNYEQDAPLEDDQFSDLAQAHAIELMDAYVYGTWELGEMPLDLRVGRQVVSWGESTFIQNGVNIINPADVSALRRPGAELKDALLPVGMLYGSLGLTPDFTVEAFIQYEWEQTQLEGCGTFFSSNDVAAEGCNKLTLFSASNRTASDYTAVNVQGLNTGDGPFDVDGYVGREADVEPSDDGQRGIALRYFAESLNSTEFGMYYVKYHSRTPFYSVRKSNGAGDGPNYFFEFPEGIEVFATSFNTTVAGWALSGELSYRPHMPLQINTSDLLQPVVSGAASWSPMFDVISATGPDGVIHGYSDDVEFTQLQFTFVKFFDRVLGASRLSFATEVGFDWLGSLPENEDVRFERSPAFGAGTSVPGAPACNATTGLVPNINPDNCTTDGYLSDFAWGYRMRASLEYPDVFAGVTLKPGLAWSHDVKGWAPSPNFNEGSKAASASLDAEYLSKYSMSISYTDFSGGDFNPLRDRDFYSLSVGASF